MAKTFIENIKKKFQDKKLPIVDEVYELDKKFREIEERTPGQVFFFSYKRKR